jgi:hypothetical protein
VCRRQFLQYPLRQPASCLDDFLIFRIRETAPLAWSCPLRKRKPGSYSGVANVVRLPAVVLLSVNWLRALHQRVALCDNMETVSASVRSRLQNFNFNQSNIHFPKFNQSSIHFPKNDELYQQWAPIQAAIHDFTSSQSTPQLAILAVTTIWILYQFIAASYAWSNPKVSTAVHHGYRSWFEPTILVQARFLISAKDIISSGFRKVCLFLKSAVAAADQE